MTDQAQKLRSLIERASPKMPHKARRIAFLSGKGGVGKTSLAVNVSIALSKLRKKTLLIDCDLGLANVDVLLGYQSNSSTDKVYTSGGDIREAVVNLPNGLWLLPGSGSVIPRQVIRNRRLEQILQVLDDKAEFIIMDGAAGIDDGVQYVARLADEAVIISTPDNTSTIDAYRLIKILLEDHRHPAIRLIVNRAESMKLARQTATGIIRAMDSFLSEKPDYLGWVPYDQIVERAGRERRPLVEKYPASDSARAIVAIAHRLINPPPVEPEAA